MRSLGHVRLVMEREIRERLRGKWFYASTVVIVVIVVGGGLLSRAIAGDDGPRQVTVAVAGSPAPGFEEALVATGELLELAVDLDTGRPAGDLRAAVTEGDVDVAVDAERMALLFGDEDDTTLHAVVQQAWAVAATRHSLTAEGLSPGAIDAALSPEPLAAQSAEPEDDTDGLALLVGMAAAIALFGALQTYGGFILMGVVEEKASAVVEVLLARVRATHLLAGKVFGIGAIALLQFLILAAAGMASLVLSGVDIPAEVWVAVASTVVWFVAGFAMYAFLYAMAGAMVSRQEDAQSAAAPVGVFLLVGYLTMFVLVGDPGSTPALVLAMVPLFTPLFMPMRIAAGETSVLEIAAAATLVSATIVGLAWLAGRIYNRLVLRRGSRVHWMEAIRSST